MPSSATNLITGDLTDPGIKSERHCLEKAKGLRYPYHIEAPVMCLLDVSRIHITFNSGRELCDAVERILTTAQVEVLWVANGFVDPHPLGYRCIKIGLRQQLEN